MEQSDTPTTPPGKPEVKPASKPELKSPSKPELKPEVSGEAPRLFRIGVPKEAFLGERRVAATPATVHQLG